MLKFTVFIAVLIAAIATVSGSPTKKHSDPIWGIVEEIILKTNTDYQDESCKNFEEFACGKIEKGSMYDNWKLDSEVKKIIDDFNETCSLTVDKEYHTRVFEITQQFDFIQSFNKKNEDTNEKFTTEELAEIVAYLSVTNELFAINDKPDQKGTFFSAQFDSSNNLLLSIYKQGGEIKEGENFALKINEFIKNANEVITNEKYDFTSLHGKEIVTISTLLKEPTNTVNQLKKVIPTKHFDWETYLQHLKKLSGVKHIRDIIIVKSDLKQLKDFFKVVDNTDVEVLMQYAANRFIFVPTYDLTIDMCEKFGSQLTNLAQFRSMWSNSLDDPEIVNAELDYLNKFENYFAKELKAVPKFENYISFKRSMLKGDDSLLKNYEKEQFYKNLINLWLNMKKADTNYHWMRSSLSILAYENKPKELFALLETYEIVKLCFEDRDWWSRDDFDIAEKCLKGSSSNTAAFIKSYIAMQYALEFFNENYKLPVGYTFEYHQLFSLLLTQSYCFTGETLEPIMEAFKHSEWFSGKWKCVEGDELYYQTLKECNMKTPYNTFVGKYMPIKFTD